MLAMYFIAPIWLLGLLPWAGVVIYLLGGQRPRAVVTFLELWRGPVVAPRPQREIRLPPIFLLLLLLAMLLAILAAAKPMGFAHGVNHPLTIILDRGITMSPMSGDGKPFRGVIELANQNLIEQFAGVSVDLVPVPGDEQQTNMTNWPAVASAMPPTALDTQAAVQTAITDRSRSGVSFPIVVLTDRHLEITDDRIVQIPPASPVNNDVGIAMIAARSQPVAQVMVRLRNQSLMHEAHLIVTSGNHKIEQTGHLPPRGETQDVLIDFPESLGEAMRVELTGHDDAAVNNRAWLVRETSWPAIDPLTPLPPPVERMIHVYTKSRPPLPSSRLIVVSDVPIPSDDAGLWIVRTTPHPLEKTIAQVTPHVLTDHVNSWPDLADPSAASPTGFTPLVTRSGKPRVAIRESPTRQLWANLDWDDWSTSPDLVIFLANAFDWLGSSSDDQYASQLPVSLGSQSTRVNDSPAPANVPNGLWPGLYRRADGVLQAVNAPDVIWTNPPKMDWQHRLRLQRNIANNGIAFSPGLCIAAVISVALAVLIWPAKENS